MLITPAYRDLNTQLHSSNVAYGTSSARWVELVQDLKAKTGAVTLLDYGCGKGLLKEGLGFPIAEYDPCIPGKDSPPDPAELVICTDVLEHIEPDCLDDVLNDLKRVTLNTIFLTVATRPAKKTLADGRNAHLIQQPWSWWEPKLSERFTIADVIEIPGSEFAVIGRKA